MRVVFNSRGCVLRFSACSAMCGTLIQVLSCFSLVTIDSHIFVSGVSRQKYVLKIRVLHFYLPIPLPCHCVRYVSFVFFLQKP